MDIVDVLSSESEDAHNSHNSDGKETVISESHKTKAIRKYYEPITEGGKLYRFQDNPAEYKRMRKKIQNRQSATRVRGRKKNAFDNLEQEVEYLKKENSQLQLLNAKLETENKSLKQQLEFMKTLVKPSRGRDLVEDYLSDEALSHPSSGQSNRGQSPSTMSEEYDSPMFEEFNWLRTESQSSNIGWLGLAIFTIVLAVFVLPSADTANVAAAFQTSTDTGQSKGSTVAQGVLYYGKVLLKYVLIVGYSWIIFRKVQNYLRGRKMKSI